VVECHVGKASFAYVRLETIVFHCGWSPIRIPSIIVGYKLIFFFCCIVLCFGTTLARGFHNIFIVHG
jgi:hypothetical protein